MIYVPPQEPEYQFQFEPVPGDPPEIPNSVEEPGQITEGVENAEVA